MAFFPKLRLQMLLLASVILLLQEFPVPANAHSEKPKSAFDFLAHLEGCHKGDNVTGIHKLKTYLEKFGYLDYKNSAAETYKHRNDDEFDNLLESAVRTYQLNYHLNPTGTLDAQTVSTMMTPRCGVPDIVNGTNYMRRQKDVKNSRRGLGAFHAVSHYSFFPGNLRWPASKYHLTYAFQVNTPPQAIDATVRAFSKWASATHFTFSRAQVLASADIKIGFHAGNHGDGSPFDGPGSTLAHAFAPTDGRFHYDAAERWSVGAVPQYFDLETVALHEIGHLLGLGHSDVPNAIMFARIPAGGTKGLHADDVQGIKALYGV